MADTTHQADQGPAAGPGETLRTRSLGERLRRWRNRLVRSAAFQRWAAAFPLTSPVARKRAARLFDLCAGFVYSQILAACVRLKLLELLDEAPRSVAEVAQACALPEDGARRLLAGMAALGLADTRHDGRYALSMDGAALLGNPGAIAMIGHHTHFYDDLRDPVALLRGETEDTALSRFWGYARGEAPADLSAAETAEYTSLMSASQSLIAEDILDGYDLSRHRHLMDVGGGDGAFIMAVAGRHPDLTLTLFDLPAVADHASQRMARAGLSKRVSIASGDFFADALPTDADIISLVRVLLDHDDASALRILRQAHAALPPGGTLLVAETLSGVRGAETISDAYFGFYLMAMGKGRPRSVGEMQKLLTQAGFRDIRLKRTRRPLLTQLITAHR
ncbi:methyltransferase [Dichotomicrobium thermohalophilum]|uniref:Hydroxyneurosporene-O-methyltransferase n=1 Tax=Dichotomicrobium thermohalophilum TaxID=933063 RepID=A0A397QB76_9HYPH|nr:methyltransferase [Dichotomicrobium thermohalophilum]RIA56737.1 hydroxyneurosporene-O-methyltransferase [Dichotomicrobium thermohalophilum]